MKMLTDITNWRDPGHNIWGFQNVEKILQVDSVSKSSHSSTWPTKLLAFDDFELAIPDNATLDLKSFLLQTETDGLVVLKNGVVVYEHYDRTNTKESIHATFSVSKSVVGLVCGILVERNELDTNNLVSIYVPEVKGSAYESVTVRQLLDMRSGINHDDASPGYRNATGFNPLEPGEKPTNLHAYIPTIHDSISAPIDGLDGPPYAYISANVDLLGWVIERATGKRFAEVLSEYLWQPMGAESEAWVALDRGGNARTAAAVCATVRDIARLGQVVCQNDQGIVPETWLGDILNNGSQAAFAAGPEKDAYKGVLDSVTYRSCWFVDQSSHILMASGINGQLLLVDRKNGVVMAKTSSQPEKTVMEKIRLSIRAFKEFTRIMQEDDE
jgi:CubicO group peptidase (beta-lactamase class C family)